MDRLICELIERIPHMDSYLETKETFPNRKEIILSFYSIWVIFLPKRRNLYRRKYYLLACGYLITYSFIIIDRTKPDGLRL